MYIQGDIHDVIKSIETKSIDLIYTNPPFGITNCKWDTPLKWKELWIEIWRVMKPRGIVVIHASMPFSYELIKSQTPRYHYCIKKSNSTGFLNARHQPMRNTEELYVFYKKVGTYNPQMVGDEIRKTTVHNKFSDYYKSHNNKERVIKEYTGRFPTTLIDMKVVTRGGKTVSDDFIDYVIKTYSNEGDTVLDMTTHNKVVGDRVEGLNRKFIGVDLLKI